MAARRLAGVAGLLLMAGCPDPFAVLSDLPPLPEIVPIDTPDEGEPPDPGPPEVVPEPDVPWDPEPAPAKCLEDPPGGLLDQVLGVGGLARESFRLTPEDLAFSEYASGELDDVFRGPEFRDVHFDPAGAPCWAEQKAVALDSLVAGEHPVTSAIRHAAILADRWPDGGPVPAGHHVELEGAIAAVLEAAGHEAHVSAIDLPDDLKAALIPIFEAIADGVAAHAALEESPGVYTASQWAEIGGLGTSVFGAFSLLEDPDAVAYLGGSHGRPKLNRAAARIAWAIEETDWSAFVGSNGVSLDLETPLGWIRIRDADDNVMLPQDVPILFHLDLGGDDIYLDSTGSNRHGEVGVNVAIDLGGVDTWSYTAVDTPFDNDWLLPADSEGRYAGDAQFGHVTSSQIPRQGGARNGIALVLDLGPEPDVYNSLAKSQGYAHLGVGVLYDAGGDDSYLAETVSQGVGVFGIGLLLDAGGNDEYRCVRMCQGSAGIGGIGVLFDGSGDDVYWADPGEADGLGHALYHSPQMPSVGNTSFSQGSGAGLRWDPASLYASGGIGILRDSSGNDRYTASVFAQGVGYWQGTGILSDGAGSDTYDAHWYAQGASAHYGLGLLLDGGPGGDRFNQVITPKGMMLGGGHDYGVGILVNETGNDWYRFGPLAVGGSQCNGIGLFVENAGTDAYATETTSNVAYGNTSVQCMARAEAVSIGVMIDAGGDDDYGYPATLWSPGNDTAFGHTGADLESEYGAGLDSVSGETGLHAR